jgi:Cation efflux family
MTSAFQPQASANNLQIGARLALIGMMVNVAFAIIKITAGVFGNSYALIADGIESALDVAGSIVIWGGLRFAARPPDETHPYGHGKAEPLTAILVALGARTNWGEHTNSFSPPSFARALHPGCARGGGDCQRNALPLRRAIRPFHRQHRH